MIVILSNNNLLKRKNKKRTEKIMSVNDESEFNDNDEKYSEMTSKQKEFYKQQVLALNESDLYHSHEIQALYLMEANGDDWRKLRSYLEKDSLVKSNVLNKVEKIFRQTAKSPKDKNIQQIIGGINKIKNKKMRKRYKGIIMFTQKLLSQKNAQDEEDETESEDESESEDKDKNEENEDEDEDESESEDKDKNENEDENEEEEGDTEDENEDEDEDEDEDEEDERKKEDNDEDEEEEEEEDEDEEEDEKEKVDHWLQSRGFNIVRRRAARSLNTEVIYWIYQNEKYQKRFVRDLLFATKGDKTGCESKLKKALKGDVPAARWIYSRLNRGLGLMQKKTWNERIEYIAEKLKELHSWMEKEKLPCGFGVGCSNKRGIELLQLPTSQTYNKRRKKIQDRLNDLKM